MYVGTRLGLLFVSFFHYGQQRFVGTRVVGTHNFIVFFGFSTSSATLRGCLASFIYVGKTVILFSVLRNGGLFQRNGWTYLLARLFGGVFAG